MEFRIVRQSFVVRHSKVIWEFTTIFSNYSLIFIVYMLTEIDLLNFLDQSGRRIFIPDYTWLITGSNN